MKNTVVVLFLLAIAVCVFSATDVTMTKTDNVERYTTTVPIPVVSGLPAGFISAAAATPGTLSAVSIGTVPSTARRVLIQANTAIYYSFSSTVTSLYPPLASGSSIVVCGAATDIDNMYFIAQAATGTVTLLYFDE